MSTTTSTDTDYTDWYTSTAAKRQAQEKADAASGKVSHTDFLKLLTTQLTTQDPLNPMQDIDFTAQLAQLQALDEQMAMTKTMSAMRADTQMQAGSNMIGKYISGTDKNGDPAAGLVTRVVQKDGSVYLELANKQHVDVTNVSDLWTDSNSMAQDIANSGAVIGMWVDAGLDENAQPIKGIVESISVSNGQVYLKLHNGTLITWDQVRTMRSPTDEDIWNALPEETRTDFNNAKEMIGKTVTGVNADGETVTGMVANVGLNDTTYDVYLILYNGDQIKMSDVEGSARTPTADEMNEALFGKFVKGLDSNSKTVSGVVVGVKEYSDGLALVLSNGKEVYYDALTEIRNATAAETEAAAREVEEREQQGGDGGGESETEPGETEETTG